MLTPKSHRVRLSATKGKLIKDVRWVCQEFIISGGSYINPSHGLCLPMRHVQQKPQLLLLELAREESDGDIAHFHKQNLR
mmetsp:Transcript_26225/g.36315  ORF Transcript_26225/g.36315 Transcript_26225/m.36315 type:complete len:80 (+) Transcript_26225:99-338(+)